MDAWITAPSRMRCRGGSPPIDTLRTKRENTVAQDHEITLGTVQGFRMTQCSQSNRCTHTFVIANKCTRRGAYAPERGVYTVAWLRNSSVVGLGACV